MRYLITGGAGFLGSHLCERLLADGHEVLCYDSLLTGEEANLEGFADHPAFRFERRDVTKDLEAGGPLDWVMHLASPASPVDYASYPIETLRVGSIGTMNCLELARDKGAGFFLASTSEVYGNPRVHPQPESYWGNVNPIGPRAVYDEAKRFAEAATFGYHRRYGQPIRVVRIFNTHGPRMRRNDGRAVPTFIDQALAGRPVTVHGDGSQTRSLCYVSDLIEGFVRIIGFDGPAQPVNIGNPGEATVLQIAECIRDLIGSHSRIVFTGRPVDDPENRQPELTKAYDLLGWEPLVPMAQGLARTVEWCRRSWG
ncbi:MAG: UDP-glucuronic acid decarboxylase family protein [Actinomycetota bacterium]